MPRTQLHWTHEDAILFLVVVSSSLGAWFLPDQYLWVVFGLLALGMCLDLLPLFYRIMMLVTGMFQSGFPLVGLVCYGWFLLAYRKSLVAPQAVSLSHILLGKFLDGLVLVGAHLFCQLPMFFKGPRNRVGA
jgi:hypothetical protein